ncbi:MAG: polymerase subunit delta [Bacteroidota bacterium]
MAKKEKGISFSEIAAKIKSKDLPPILLLQGSEPWFIDELVELVEEHVLEPHEKDFNLTVLYGRDSSFDQIVSASQRYPMMAEKQVVIVKEAQDLAGWKREADREYFLKYTESPQQTTLLVLAHKYGVVASNTRIYKGIETAGAVFVSEPIEGPALLEWIEEFAAEHAMKIAPESTRLLAEYLGSNLSKLTNAIKKLEVTLGKGNTITNDAIERYIGISKDYNIFELQQALAVKDVLKANKIINYFEANPKEHNINMVTAVLATYFLRLLAYHDLTDKSQRNIMSVLRVPFPAVPEIQAAGANFPPEKVARAFELLRETDRKAKGIDNASISEGNLLRELVFNLLH